MLLFKNKYFDNNFQYDYGSVMHYGKTAFGTSEPDGRKRVTIETIDPAQQDVIGQRNGMSELDIKELNDVYG